MHASIEDRLAALEQGANPLGLHSRRALQRFYEAVDFQPLWTGNTADRVPLRRLVTAIDLGHDQGLTPAHYHRAALGAALDGNAENRDLAATELLATDAWMLLASHYASGRVHPLTVDAQWHATRRDFDGARALEQAVEDGDPVAGLNALLPRQAEYGRLLALLARYRAAADWGSLPAGPDLEAGRVAARVGALRRRLAASGDLPPGAVSDDPAFDAGLEAAVRRFQERHGLTPDGVVGKETRAALNVSRAERIRQIRVNLERWRWLPPSLGRRHVRVNIADYRVEAWQDGSPAFAMKAIVGRSYRRTPVFSGEMTYLVLNPTWIVPTSIAVKDKLPHIREDSGYLARGGYEVWLGGERVDPAGVDWSALGPENFPYRLRQRPGRGNALGQVKFMFPNPFDVYLHDTSDPQLFAYERRTFSSGCIRIEQPLQLLEWVLAGTPAWDMARARTALESGKEQVVRLQETIPVHIEYWTAWVDASGRPQFRPDVYQRDASIAAALDEDPPR